MVRKSICASTKETLIYEQISVGHGAKPRNLSTQAIRRSHIADLISAFLKMYLEDKF